jgi:N-acetylneuraminic acid mutarotase
VSSVYEYVPELDQWNEMTPMSVERGFAGAAVAGGKIYVIGGYDGTGGLDLNEVFIPELEGSVDGPWNSAESLPNSRFGMGIAGLGNMVHVVGGENGEGGSQSSLVYSPQEDIWQEFDSPSEKSLANFGLVPLDTQLYVVGGELGDELTAINAAYQAIYTFVIPIIP